ncbi:hypothetical protein K0M31_012179 [Melipona bicolor]|uniref:Uncharacterized protein n=1 Tax=Melipona bicolor TaxID=60889 RepID=A0AA40FK98_9HYME|nr:hypothetical protein K0M31_012179 [Melipona bicolor]
MLVYVNLLRGTNDGEGRKDERTSAKRQEKLDASKKEAGIKRKRVREVEIKKEHDEKEEKKEELRRNKGYPSNVNLTLGMGSSPLSILPSRIPKKLFLTGSDATKTFDCVWTNSNSRMNIYEYT